MASGNSSSNPLSIQCLGGLLQRLIAYPCAASRWAARRAWTRNARWPSAYENQCPPTHPHASWTRSRGTRLGRLCGFDLRMPPGKPPVSFEVSDSSPTTARAATTTTATGCVPQSRVTVQRREGASGCHVIARFDGDVDQFRRAYDRAHAY